MSCEMQFDTAPTPQACSRGRAAAAASTTANPLAACCGLQQRDCFGDRADFWTAAGRTMSSHPLQTICGHQKARYDAYAAHR